VTTRDQFLSRLQRYCRRRGLAMAFDPGAGKGSHGRVVVEGRATIVKSGQLSPVYQSLVLKQLGLPKDALNG
jgi:hypothetical protein